MAKLIEKFVAGLSIFLLVVILGCAAFQQVLTPCWISPAVIHYADANATSVFPWTTLFDAKRVDLKLDFIHILNQLTDNLEYDYLKGISRAYIAAGEELQATLFDPAGPIGLLVTTGLGTTIGGLLIPRSKDKRKIKKLEKQNNSKNT